VSAVVICRPTTRRYRYAQMVGRGLRPSDGKDYCLVVDFDWETDSEARELAHSVDIFDDGSLAEDIIGIAREIERRSRGVKDDPMEIVAEAEEVYRVRSRLQIKLTGASEKYRAVEMDPVGVGKILDFPLTKSKDYDRRGNNPASAAQLGMLRHLGIRNPDGLSKWGASKMIDKLRKRQDSGGAGASVVRELLVAGVSPEIARGMSAEAARVSIAEIDRVSRIMNYQQGRLFDA
jgi:hypothetical protein